MKLQLLHALLLLQLVNFSAAFPAQLPRRTNKHTPTNIAATSHDNNCHAARREGLLSSDVIVEIPTSTATRRKALMRIFGGIVAMSTAAASNGNVANAAADCFQDCLKNCRLIAPKDSEYCTSNCQEYWYVQGFAYHTCPNRIMHHACLSILYLLSFFRHPSPSSLSSSPLFIFSSYLLPVNALALRLL